MKQRKLTYFIKTRDKTGTESGTQKDDKHVKGADHEADTRDGDFKDKNGTKSKTQDDKEVNGTDNEADSLDGDFSGDAESDAIQTDDLSVESSESGSDKEDAKEAEQKSPDHLSGTTLKADNELAKPIAKEVKKAIVEEMDDMTRLLVHNTVATLNRIDHHLLPAMNVFPRAMHFAEMRTYPNCQLSAPHPVYVAAKHADRIDVCHQRTIRRENYKQRLLFPYGRYQTAQKSKQVRAQEKRGKFHKSVFDIAERLELTPDFSGPYDYYYTGGNLCVLPDSHRVLHVGGNNLRDLHVSEFSKNGNQLQKLFTRHMKEGSEIFEIQALRQYNAGVPNCFALRHRNSIFLGSVRDTSSVKALTRLTTERTPFISFAQSPVDNNVLVVTTTTSHMRCYDLNHGTKALKERYEMSAQASDGSVSWNIVRPWRKNTFLYANPKDFFVADLRTTPKEWRRNVCGFAPDDFSCDNITAVMASNFENLAYVATVHKLHCLDMRYPGRYFEDCRGGRALCRWTHQMRHATVFMDALRHDRNEWVTMASPVAGDVCVCELTHNSANDSYRSYTLPYQPPTMQEAYEHARLAGNCLQPESDLRHRTLCCTTGLTTHSRTVSENVLMTANSNGDVFVRNIRERRSQDEEQRCDDVSDAMMASYAGRICELAQPPLKFTKVQDLKAMRKVFRCVALNTNVKEEQTPQREDVPIAKRRSMGRWQKSMQSLHSYKDAIASDILAVWDIDYEKEANLSMRQIEASVTIKTDPEFKVNEWLETTSQPHPMTSIPTYLLNNTNAAAVDTISLKYEDFNDNPQDQATSTQMVAETNMSISALEPSAMDIAPHQTLPPTKARQKPPRKKAKYVKGF